MAWSEMKTKDADDAAEKQQQQQQPTAMVMKMKAVDAGAAGGEAITGRSRKEEGKEWGSGNGDRPTRVVSVVRMPPRSRATSDPSLSLHVEDVEDHQSSRNLWQVYALGAFMVGRWVWGRWRERRAGRSVGDDNEDG